MKITFYAADKDREHDIAGALQAGASAFGDEVEVVPLQDYAAPRPETEVCALFGVKGRSREIMESHWRAGKHTLYFDKGYLRTKVTDENGRQWSHWRISVDSFQPLCYFRAQKRPPDRFNQWGRDIMPRQRSGQDVLFAGGSQKYCDWHRLGDAQQYAISVIEDVRRRTKRQIIYRPKPSWKEALPIEGTRYSRHPERIDQALQHSHACITYGSNAALDALLRGVPAIVLGDSIARPLAETDLDRLENPFWPTDDERYRWACQVAYCQWTASELRSGLAWQHLRQEIENGRALAHQRSSLRHEPQPAVQAV